MIGVFGSHYPPPDSGKTGYVIAILFGVFIGLFLLFFQPFDLNVSKFTSVEVLFFGVISTFTFLFYQILLPQLWPALFNEKHWTVSHQILFYLCLAFTIATFNGMYINYINQLAFSWENYWYIIVRTAVLGSIPISFIVLYNYNRALKTNVANAAQFKEKLEVNKNPSPEQPLLIHTHLKETTFSLQEDHFLYAQSSGNYLYIYQTASPKSIYRISLNSLEEQLNSSHLIRTHRSYLVNLNKVKQVTGNAQGLKLFLETVEEPIPVSRKYIESVKAYFESSHN